jgi:ketosteroid isomerase-like protein
MTSMTSTTSGAHSPTSPEQLAAAAAWVARFAEHWSPLEPARLVELMHEDTQNLIPPMTEPANRAGVIEHFQRTKAQLPDLELTVERWAATGDSVFVEWVAEATVKGTRIAWRGIDRVRLRDGRTYAGQAFWDTRRVAELVARALEPRAISNAMKGI